MKWLILAPLLAAGCISFNSISPLPCREIDEVPGLEEELLSARDLDNMLQQLRMPPQTEKLRDYVIESSSKCHGNKKLR